MYLILPVPVVLRLIAFTLQLSEIIDHFVNTSLFEIIKDTANAETKRLIKLSHGLVIPHSRVRWYPNR
jgi:hypothetical protein